MRIFTRLAVACLASLLCIWTAFCFYPPGQPRLVDVALTNSGHVEHLWRWMAGPSRLERDARIVVLGDHSVVDGNEKHAGKSWPRQWCDMLHCQEYHNFAVARIDETGPTGAIVSNRIWMEKTGFKIDNETTPNNLTAVKPVLSDLAAQVHAFLELPEPFPAVESSYVVLAFGHWDIYHVAALDFAIGAEYIDAAVVEIFEQLQRIYSRAPGSLQAKHLPKIILPRLLGPSLAPGWLVQRPEPMAPRSVAWEQSTAAMLNKRWTEQMDLRLREWLEYAAPVEHIDYIGVDEASRLSGSETKAPTTMTPEASSPSTNGRIAYILDIPHLVQSIKINHYFARSKISDANNLGKHQDVYDDVDSSCAIRDSTDDNKRWHQPDRHQQRIVDISHGTLQCEKPGRWLWWDSWNLGGRVKERIAEVMSAMVREQHTAATTFLEEDRTQQLHQQREQARWRLKDMETEKHAQEDRARQEEEARAKKLKGLPERGK